MDDGVRVCVPHCVDFELYYVHAFLSINVRLSKKNIQYLQKWPLKFKHYHLYAIKQNVRNKRSYTVHNALNLLVELHEIYAD